MTFPIRGYSRRADIQRVLVSRLPHAEVHTRGVSARPEIRHRFPRRGILSVIHFTRKLSQHPDLRLILPLNKKSHARSDLESSS